MDQKDQSVFQVELLKKWISLDQFGSEWIMVRIDILKYSTRYTGLNTRTVNKVCSKRRIVESSNCRIIVDEIFDETMIFIFSRNNFSDSKLQIYLRVYIKIESPKDSIFFLSLLLMMMMMNECCWWWWWWWWWCCWWCSILFYLRTLQYIKQSTHTQ